MTRLEEFAALLEGVSPFRKNKDGIGFTARCPAHNDRSPSLNVTEKPDGTLLVYCHALCGSVAVLDAVGKDPSFLFPHDLTKGRGNRSVKDKKNPILRHNFKSLCDVPYQTLVESFLLMRSGKPVDEIGVLLMQNAAKMNQVAEQFRSASYE